MFHSSLSTSTVWPKPCRGLQVKGSCPIGLRLLPHSAQSAGLRVGRGRRPGTDFKILGCTALEVHRRHPSKEKTDLLRASLRLVRRTCHRKSVCVGFLTSSEQKGFAVWLQQ